MPICTICTHRIPYLYTVYESAHNLRLEQCPNCLNFADPYVEHDSLTLLLDLILLKRDVFRHLLYNRGYPPRNATQTANGGDLPQANEQAVQAQREKERWRHIMHLGLPLIFVDAFIRWSHIERRNDRNDPIWARDGAEPLLRIFAGCIIETFAFHVGVAFTSILMLKTFDCWRVRVKGLSPTNVRDGLRRVSHVPLTILYSSLTKLFLLLLLALWKPSTVSSPRTLIRRTDMVPGAFDTFLYHAITQRALEILDDDKLDREWIVRNVLGGLSAGFGLRVVLDIPPPLTTVIILVGWALKTFVANLVSSWVNKGDTSSNVFLAYSIP